MKLIKQGEQEGRRCAVVGLYTDRMAMSVMQQGGQGSFCLYRRQWEGELLDQQGELDVERLAGVADSFRRLAQKLCCPCLKEKQMLISPWMTTEAISVQPDTSLSRCQKLMKEHGVRRLPVVDDSNRVIGIISDRDVKSASPSKATSLEVHEIQYLLAEVKAKDIMTSNPICVKSNESISKVALIMLDKKIGGMPVVDDDNHLLGIITDQDVFRVLVTIGGAREPGIELTVETSQEPGSLARVFDIVRKNKGRIVSVMTAYLANGNRHVFIRLRPFEDESASASLKEALETQTNLLEWTICSGMAD